MYSVHFSWLLFVCIEILIKLLKLGISKNHNFRKMTILKRSFSPLKIQHLSTTVLSHLPGKNTSAASDQKQQESSDSSKHAKKKTESLKKIPTYLNESEYIKKELPKPFGNFLLNTRRIHFHNLYKIHYISSTLLINWSWHS